MVLGRSHAVIATLCCMCRRAGSWTSSFRLSKLVRETAQYVVACGADLAQRRDTNTQPEIEKQVLNNDPGRARLQS